ncbi:MULTISPECIES: LytTR family DNA-binding domain-containing protein [Chryseobacterium]|uniref:Aerobic respiration control protein ArcA n=1 Tax=Chryseobacterium salivictor TaxID=2547600 RepID=A0A4V1AL73_9FLAO|nr:MULTISPECIES: response regulator transcription factor [Chryseobacterium]MDQ0477080.1 two-component system response regulator LytT [Chryseobacterium sp. MDT2-18]QBO58764.1 Aerobic respiration control protein ArcA [Chryseobacterium salivictor]
MQHLNILIVEDEILIADFIRDLLEESGYRSVFMAHTAAEARDKMQQVQPDLILMDLNLEGGFEGITLSQQKNEDAAVIFITGQSDGATIEKALATSPESYLTKPIRKIELLTALKIATNKKKKHYIFVKDGYHDVKLVFEDMLYVKADRNYLDIMMVGDRKITIRNTLSEFCKELPVFFKQIHRSVVVNSQYVNRISSDEVAVQETVLPLSRNFRKNFVIP